MFLRYDGLYLFIIYSHLSNKHGGWNEYRGGAKVVKSLNMEVGINIFLEKTTGTPLLRRFLLGRISN